MWFTKKQKEKWILDNRDEVIRLLNIVECKPEQKKEEPKPTERKAIMEIILINNNTDKEYSIKSENDFGLTWDYVRTKESNYELLIINQYHSIGRDKWTAVGRFINFSVLKSNWQTFKIEDETLKKD